jgi:hypothetical protein
MDDHNHLENFWLWHITHSTTGTRKTAAVATYYVEEMKEAKTCILINIKELCIYEEQVQCLATPTTLMAHAIADRENAFQQ